MFLFLLTPEEFFFFILGIKGYYNSSKFIPTGIWTPPKNELVKEIMKLAQIFYFFLKRQASIWIQPGVRAKDSCQALCKTFPPGMRSSGWRDGTHYRTRINQICNAEQALLQDAVRNGDQIAD